MFTASSDHQTRIVERDSSQRIHTTHFTALSVPTRSTVSGLGEREKSSRIGLVDLLREVFLPVGFPDSVSPDYLRYQALNALQAFCSSLASLIASRAVLEGFGVGNASASATDALLITAFQDVCSRLTTILSAYLIGSYLVAEAKKYRFLADVLNDLGLVLDSISPLLKNYRTGIRLPEGRVSEYLMYHGLDSSLGRRLPGLRVVALCLSGSAKALCGIAAGGSKAALTLHFASTNGDIGDLNAKDASKETVLSLLGMLMGTIVVPYLTTPTLTYSVLFILLGLHLMINYIAVRGLVLTSFNQQRLALAWSAYKHRGSGFYKPGTSLSISPTNISALERMFASPNLVRDATNGNILGRCTMGSSLSQILRTPLPPAVTQIFQSEKYIIWFDNPSLASFPKWTLGPSSASPARKSDSFLRRDRFRPHLHICLKDGYTSSDQLKAWTHACEIARIASKAKHSKSEGADDDAASSQFGSPAVDMIAEAYATLHGDHNGFDRFMETASAAGWKTKEGLMATGAPKGVITSIYTGSEDLVVKGLTDEKKRVS